MNDYVALLTELVEILKKSDSTEEVVAWLEERQSKLLPLRIKIRALLENNAIDPKKLPTEASRLFVGGLWGVMKGGISIVEDGHTPMREYGMGDHTVLDLLRTFRSPDTYPITDSVRRLADSVDRRGWYITKRKRYIEIARRQMSAIEAAWKDVAKGYAVLKRESLRPA
jgi:hypothetical protein